MTSTIKALESAYTAADAEFRAASAVLEAAVTEWRRSDQFVRTASRTADPLEVFKAERAMVTIEREAQQIEQRVRDAALARTAAEVALHAAQRELRVARQNLARLDTLPTDQAVRYHTSDLQRIEQQAKETIRRLA